MANWQYKINIKDEMQELNKLCANFSDDYVFMGDVESQYFNLIKRIENKFSNCEYDIKYITDDDGTYDTIMDEIESLMFAIDIESSRYSMENLYEICDAARIWLIQQ